MLNEFEEKNGVTLMDGTGVSEQDILENLLSFNKWAIMNKDKSLVEYFTKKHMNPKVIRAFALIGMKHIVGEYSEIITAHEEEKKEENK